MGSKPKHQRGRPRTTTNAFGRWIDRSKLSRDEVAERLRLSRQYVDRLCRDDRRPDLELAVKIEDLTRGKIRPRDWLRTPRHSGD